jgi:hypothetical protein
MNNGPNTTQVSPLRRRWIGLGLRSLRTIALAGAAVWSIMAVYYSNLPSRRLQGFAAAVYALALFLILLRVRPRWLARTILLGAFAVVAIWFLLIPPSNDRDWLPDVAVLPYSEIDGDRVTLHNVRNCDYRSETDFTVSHYDRTYDLTKLQSVDLYVVHWGSPLIAHTMLSFGFAGGDYVCFSIETRKERGEAYSAIKGFFRQFELIYIVGDERDLVRLRTNFRSEEVYLYHLNTDVATARLVFLDYLKVVNRLKDRPEWYNALTSNCTTNIRGHTRPYAKNKRFDWRILLNGRVDEMAYERKALDQTLPFDQLKARSLINESAKAANHDPDFSQRIRESLPGFRPVDHALIWNGRDAALRRPRPRAADGIMSYNEAVAFPAALLNAARTAQRAVPTQLNAGAQIPDLLKPCVE